MKARWGSLLTACGIHGKSAGTVVTRDGRGSERNKAEESAENIRVKSASITSAVAVAVLAADCVQAESTGATEAVEGLAGEGSGAECVIDDPVQVGAVYSLTGGASSAGQYQQEGLQLRVSKSSSTATT